MARFTDFIRGYQMGRQMVLDSRAEAERQEMAKIGQAKPEESEGFTAEQGEQLRAAADSGQYDIGFDQPQGTYTVRPRAGGETGLIAKQRVTDFLGERVAGSMTDRQQNDARARAMAGVLTRSNPLAGLRMQREIEQAQRTDKLQDLQMRDLERRDRAGARGESDIELMHTIDNDVGKAIEQRLAQPDGTQRAMTVDDHLYGTQLRAGRLLAAGRANEAGQAIKDYQAQAFAKINLQTAERNEALGQAVAAMNAGDLSKVRDFYNTYIPDGMQVTDVARDPKSGAVVIKRSTLEGGAAPDFTLRDTGQLTAALATFKDPMAVYNWSQNEFQNNLRLNADRRADAQLHLSVNADRRAGANAARAAGDGLAKSEAAVALYKENNPGATQAQLEAVRRGVLDAVPQAGKNAPAEVKLAQAMLDAGMATDMRSALEMAVTRKSQSPEEIHRTFVEVELKNMRPAADAVKAADEVMASMGYAKSGGRWRAPGGGSESRTSASGAKYPEGTELKGKDGKLYVVRNGVPVPR